jgi:hypothetical protein
MPHHQLAKMFATLKGGPMFEATWIVDHIYRTHKLPRLKYMLHILAMVIEATYYLFSCALRGCIGEHITSTKIPCQDLNFKWYFNFLNIFVVNYSFIGMY